jgi:hypothetical protein
MGIGPTVAVPKLLARHGLTVDQIDLWELNEAFAVVPLHCSDVLGIDPEKMNVNGGERDMNSLLSALLSVCLSVCHLGSLRVCVTVT